MIKYNEVNVKLSNTQLKKLKDAVKDNTATTLRKFLMVIIYRMNYY